MGHSKPRDDDDDDTGMHVLVLIGAAFFSSRFHHHSLLFTGGPGVKGFFRWIATVGVSIDQSPLACPRSLMLVCLAVGPTRASGWQWPQALFGQDIWHEQQRAVGVHQQPEELGVGRQVGWACSLGEQQTWSFGEAGGCCSWREGPGVGRDQPW